MNDPSHPQWVNLPDETTHLIVRTTLATLESQGVVAPPRTISASCGCYRDGDRFLIQTLVVLAGTAVADSLVQAPATITPIAPEMPATSPSGVSLPDGFFKGDLFNSRRLRVLGLATVVLLLVTLGAMLGSTIYRAGRVSAGLECTRDMAQMVAREVRKP